MATEEEETFEIDGEGTEAEEPLVYDEDAPNLVTLFKGSAEGDGALEKISSQVVRDAEAASESMEDYRQRVADDYRVFSGELRNKDYPWENCANPNLPFVMENIARVHARVSDEIFGDWKNVFAYLGIGPEDELIAELMSAHDNWQITSQIPGFRNNMERGLLQFLFQGDAFCQSGYDPISKTNCHEILTPDDLYIPYVSVTTCPDMSDIPYKVRVLRYYRHDMEKMRGLWENVDAVLGMPAPGQDEEPDEPLAEAAADVENIQIPSDDPHAPYKLYWYEGYMELPSQKDLRYCKAVVDTSSKKVLLLTIMEEAPWDEVQRYQQQIQEQQAYMEAVQSYEEHFVPAMQMDNELRARLQSPDVDPTEAEALQMGMDADPLPQLAPQPSGWLTGVADPATALPELPRKRPISSWSHESCIMPLKSVFGLSLGRIQSDLARAANTALGQFTDAAHLANNWGLVVPGGMSFDQPFRIQPGHVNKVKGMTGPEIQKSFVQLKPDPANPQLIDIVKMMAEWGQSSMQSPDVLSGQSGKSGETYRGLATRIEQAYKQLGYYARRYGKFFESVLERNADLNARHLPEDTLREVFDHLTLRMREIRVGRGFWQQRKRLTTLHADMRFSTVSQRVQEADELGQLPQMVPALQTNLAYQYKTIRKMLEARGADDLIETLGEQPPPPPIFGAPPQPPPGVMPPGVMPDPGMEGA